MTTTYVRVAVTYSGHLGHALVPSDGKPQKGVWFTPDDTPDNWMVPTMQVPVMQLVALDPAQACRCGKLATYKNHACGDCLYQARDFQTLWFGWTGVQS